jgi:hypothetical protein
MDDCTRDERESISPGCRRPRYRLNPTYSLAVFRLHGLCTGVCIVDRNSSQRWGGEAALSVPGRVQCSGSGVTGQHSPGAAQYSRKAAIVGPEYGAASGWGSTLARDTCRNGIRSGGPLNHAVSPTRPLYYKMDKAQRPGCQGPGTSFSASRCGASGRGGRLVVSTYTLICNRVGPTAAARRGPT